MLTLSLVKIYFVSYERITYYNNTNEIMFWTLLVITQNNCQHKTYLVTSNGELLV